LRGPVTLRPLPAPLRGAPAQNAYAPIVTEWGDFVITLSDLPKSVQTMVPFSPLLHVEAAPGAVFDQYRFHWADESELVYNEAMLIGAIFSNALDVYEERVVSYTCNTSGAHLFNAGVEGRVLKSDPLAESGQYSVYGSVLFKKSVLCTSTPPPPKGNVEEIVFIASEYEGILHALGLSVDFGQGPPAATAAEIADLVRSVAAHPFMLLSYPFLQRGAWGNAFGGSVPSHAVFLTNRSSKFVSSFVFTDSLVDAAGSPVSVPALPLDLAITPAGEYLYVSTTAASELYGFAVNLGDASLTPLSGSPFATASGHAGLQVSPDGKFLYGMATYPAEVHVYAIAVDGALSEIAGSPYPTVLGQSSTFGLMHPSGDYYFAPLTPQIYFGTTGIITYGVDKGTGALDSLSTAYFPHRRLHMVAHPGGNWIYATNPFDNKVSAFAVNLANGALTEIHAALDTGDRPYIATINDAGTLLVVTNGVDATVSVYAIDQTTGALTEVTNSPFGVATAPYGVLMIPKPPAP